MVAGALTAIFFVCTLICWGIWTVMYSMFVTHYLLTTLTDSSSGQDEVQFPSETIFDWWWKPILFGWVLLMFVVPATLILIPLGLFGPETFGIVWVVVLWFLYPLGLASALYTQNWLKVIHVGVIGRMLSHFGAFVYVYLMTFALCAGALWLVYRTLTDSLLWGVPAVVCLPAAFLLYARHWGRFAWLSLNHFPRYARRPSTKSAPAERTVEDPWSAPEPSADVPTNAPSEKQPAETPPAEDVDYWTDTSPYTVITDASQPSFEETPTAPPAPVPAQAVSAHLAVEEEDEWATDKKPYNLSEPDPVAAPEQAAPASAGKKKSDINKPIVLSQYYDERAKKEKEEKRKAEIAKRTMPALSKKTPTFYAALIAGVWKFMLYQGTLQAWGTLVALTMVEVFFLYLLVLFMPKV